MGDSRLQLMEAQGEELVTTAIWACRLQTITGKGASKHRTTEVDMGAQVSEGVLELTAVSRLLSTEEAIEECKRLIITEIREIKLLITGETFNRQQRWAQGSLTEMRGCSTLIKEACLARERGWAWVCRPPCSPTRWRSRDSREGLPS